MVEGLDLAGRVPDRGWFDLLVATPIHRCPSVLSESGLAEYTPYEGARLTDAGRTLALRVLRRHRLIERLLYDALQFPWDEVHEEAERLEHAISDRLETALLARYGEKATCPHGYPVTPRTARRGRLLADLAEGQDGSIVRVYEKEPALLKLFAALKLLPGSRVRLIRRLPDDTFEILVNQRKVQVGLKAARGLWLVTDTESPK